MHQVIKDLFNIKKGWRGLLIGIALGVVIFQVYGATWKDKDVPSKETPVKVGIECQTGLFVPSKLILQWSLASGEEKTPQPLCYKCYNDSNKDFKQVIFIPEEKASYLFSVFQQNFCC